MWGQHLRLFTLAEEESLAEFIRCELLPSGCIFQDADFHACAMAAWFEKYGRDRHIKPFNCSDGDLELFASGM
jgi:hypothetical protein